MLSPDLTRHDPKTMGVVGRSDHARHERPRGLRRHLRDRAVEAHDANVIWTGSDDGLIHVTKDAGKTWTNVTPKDMPDFGRVSIIDASAFDSATVYAAVKRPLLDDKAPYIFRTHDFGKTWTKIVTGIRADDYVHSVREDPNAEGSALRRDAAWRLHLVRRRRSLGIAVAESARRADARHRGRSITTSRSRRTAAASTFSTTSTRCVSSSRRWKPSRTSCCSTPAAAIRSGTPATDPVLAQASGAERAHRHSRRDGANSCAADRTRRTPAVARWRRRRLAVDAAAALGAAMRDPVAKTAGLNSFTWDGRYPNAVTFPGMILWGATTNGPLAAPGKYTVRLTADGKRSRPRRSCSSGIRSTKRPTRISIAQTAARAADPRQGERGEQRGRFRCAPSRSRSPIVSPSRRTRS